MELSRCVAVLFALFSVGCMVSPSQACRFIVGGKDGWVPKPSEDYNHWAQRQRFEVNSTLVFNYKKGSDSVMLVTEQDYQKCETRQPILELKDGNSVFKLNNSGHVFFISGISCNCMDGERLDIVVLAVRNHHNDSQSPPPMVSSPPSPPPSKAPSAEPSANSSSDGGWNAPPPPPPRATLVPTSFAPGLRLGGFRVGAGLILGTFVGLF